MLTAHAAENVAAYPDVLTVGIEVVERGVFGYIQALEKLGARCRCAS
jgi:hypothetical protein